MFFIYCLVTKTASLTNKQTRSVNSNTPRSNDLLLFNSPRRRVNLLWHFLNEKTVPRILFNINTLLFIFKWQLVSNVTNNSSNRGIGHNELNFIFIRGVEVIKIYLNLCLFVLHSLQVIVSLTILRPRTTNSLCWSLYAHHHKVHHYFPLVLSEPKYDGLLKEPSSNKGFLFHCTAATSYLGFMFGYLLSEGRCLHIITHLLVVGTERVLSLQQSR